VSTWRIVGLLSVATLPFDTLYNELLLLSVRSGGALSWTPECLLVSIRVFPIASIRKEVSVLNIQYLG
jgi:hypothetical protein